MADLRTINDGGPAFPAARTEQVGMLSDHGIVEEGSRNDAPTFGEVSYPGMSLRDWFAGQALAGFTCTANEELPMEDGETVDVALARHWSVSARAAYIVADAMLAAREAPDA